MQLYAGNEAQVRLQRIADKKSLWLRQTPGACHSGRMVGVDDADTLGWDTILEHLSSDGALSFRLLAADRAEGVRRKLAAAGFRIDFWDVFAADAQTARAACAPAADVALNDGLEFVAAEESGDAAMLGAVQACMVRNGIAPFSGYLLGGGEGPSCLVAIRNGAGEVIATAFGYFPHGVHSGRHGEAWGGLVAVDEGHRGHGLGYLVNARMIFMLAERLGATRVHEFASSSNLPSRRMIERCGLALDPSVVAGIATTGENRFTR